MKLQDLMTVLGIAGVTAAFALVAFGPQGVGAVDGPTKIKPIFTQPEFKSQECVFSLKTDKETYEAGQSPTFTVTVSNPTEKPAEATVWIVVSASAPMSRLARMLPIPESVWSHKLTVNLKPGETRKETIETKLSLPAGKDISITLSDKNQAVMAGGLSTRASTVPIQQLPTKKKNAESKP
ncbi:MAG: hypothetical protein ACYC35_12530 [Pirellulales bacterium]